MDPMMYDLLDDMSVDGHTVRMRCQCGTSFCPFVTLRAALLKCGPEDDTDNNYANWVMSAETVLPRASGRPEHRTKHTSLSPVFTPLRESRRHRPSGTGSVQYKLLIQLDL